MEPAPIGLIAGGGRLPVVTAQGIRQAGRKVACVGLRDHFEPDLPGLCDHFATAGMIQLGRWVRLLRRQGVREAVMVGRVDKRKMYDQPWRWLRHRPDWRAARLWFGRLRHDRRTDAVLRALADDMQEAGITLIDSTHYIPQCLADPGPMTPRTRPTDAQQADIEFALPIIRRLGDLDIGQAIAVKDREVIAVEALEGTDAMIRRAGELCRSGKWLMLKVAKPRQDMRVDVPTVGLNTIGQLHEAGATCLAVEVGRVILLDKPQLLAEADRLGIAVVGVA